MRRLALERMLSEARQARWFWRMSHEPANSAIWRAVRDGMHGAHPAFHPRRRGSVHVVGMVRDEVDVIDGFMEHHLAQGVDRILVADNRSKDGTRERLAEWARREHRVTVLDDHLEAFYQGFKVTYLARMAWAAGADWVVPADADERWMGPDDALKGVLSRTQAAVVRAATHNAYPTAPEDGQAAAGTSAWRLDCAPHPTVKVAFRAHPFAKISDGNHHVRRPGDIADGLHVLHIPWRSRDQLARKVANGASALGAAAVGPGVDGHWFTMAEADPATFDSIWAEIAGGPTTTLDFGYKPVGPFVPLITTTLRCWNEAVIQP